MSDSEASQTSVEPSQKFESQEDDDETLWEVIEITGERANQYKVRWKGDDPKTMKPWPQSWVNKSDCTDDLVKEWKQKCKNKGIGTKPGKSSRSSAASKKTARESTSTVGTSNTKRPVASGSRVTRRSTSTATTTTENASARRASRASVSSERKKATAVPAGVIEITDDDDKPIPPKVKGKKRKLAEVTSANSSTYLTSRDSTVGVKVDKIGGAPHPIVPRPKKKRKIQVEVVQPEPEDQPEEEEEEEAPKKLDKGKGKAITVEEDVYDNSEQPRRASIDLKAKADVEPADWPNPFNDEENFEELGRKVDKEEDHELADDEENHERMIEDALSQASPTASEYSGSRPPSRKSPSPPMKFGPPTSKKRRGPAKPKAHHISPPAATKASNSIPPSTRPKSPSAAPDIPDKRDRAPTKERSVFWDEVDELQYPEPELSPAAQERLALFDEEVIGIPRNKSKSRTVKPVTHEAFGVKTSKESAPDPIPVNGITASGSDSQAKHLQSTEEVATASKPPLIVQNVGQEAKILHESNVEYQVQAPSAKLSKSISPIAIYKAVATSSKPPSNIHDNEIIPETDESQSQEYKSPPKQPNSPIKPAHQSYSNSRSQVPKESGPSKPKTLRPIPILSPRAFHPHLPPPSLPEDISEDVDPQPASKFKTDTNADHDDDDNMPMSSIEQFESPEKKPSKSSVIVAPSKASAYKIKAREATSSIWESDMVKRGRELAAEAAKKRRGSSAGNEISLPKRTMQDIINKTRSRSNSNLSVADSERSVAKHTSIPEYDEDGEDVTMAGISTDVVPSASGPPQATPEDVEREMWELEKAYIDLSGSTGPRKPADTLLLREEEEESTQDLMMDVQQTVEPRPTSDVLTEGWGVKPAEIDLVKTEPAAPAAGSLEDRIGSSGGISAPKEQEFAPPKITLEPTEAIVQPSVFTNDSLHVPCTTRLRSRSRTPILRKSPAPVASNGSRQKSLDPVASKLNIHLSSVDEPLTLMIVNLQAELASERAKNTELLQTVSTTQSQLDTTNPQNLDITRQLADLKAQYDSEKAEWENKKLQLTVQLDSANKSKKSADSDRDFFRNQYAQASGFVSSVRDENKDLEKRIKIAEEQSQNGVKLIKETFNLRLKALEDDLKSWRMMAEFLIEKDRRTGNDEIRRRAAEEPELRALCQRQAASYAKAQSRIIALEADLKEYHHHNTDLEAEVEALKDETTKLKHDLNEAIVTHDNHLGGGDASSDTREDDMVYVCKIRSDQNEQCREVFSTYSELEQHLLVPGGHLQ